MVCNTAPVIQTDNGNVSGGQMLKQYVWGLQYIDELCQIGVNQDPNNATYAMNGASYQENECEFYYYPLQDANYNNLGVITAAGRLVERYEYTPYGQRVTYSHGILLPDIDGDGFVGITDLNIYLASDPRADLNGDGSVGISDQNVILSYWNQGTPANDPLVTYPTLQSSRELKLSYMTGLTTAPLCEVGHQGLFHDEEFGSQGGLIHNRARTLHPRLGRFMQRDPLGYVDGASSYQYQKSKSVRGFDPLGLAFVPGPDTEEYTACCKNWKYNPETECCVDDVLVSNSKQITVKVCWRGARLPGGAIADAGFGFHHMWLKASFGEVGLGEIDTVGAPDEQGGFPTPYPQSGVVDHTGQANQFGANCIDVQVSECCIREQMKQRATGRRCGPTYNCNTYVSEAISACGANADEIFKRIREIDPSFMDSENMRPGGVFNGRSINPPGGFGGMY